MSDWYYKLVRNIGTPAFSISATPVVLHRQRAARAGRFLLAANHLSPFDVSCLIKETPRLLDFVSITEVFKNPYVAWFYSNMNAMPIDRGRVDTATTRTILGRLERDRAVAIFPEARIQTDENSILNGGKIKPGVFRIAHAAMAPVLPCVVLGTRAYFKIPNWFPGRKVVFAINYGKPLFPDERWADTSFVERLYRDAMVELHRELLAALEKKHLLDRVV